MRIYTLCCSGRFFPVQVALMMEAYDILKKPDIMLGSSGGNLTAYIALAGDFSPEGIQRICRGINSELLSHSWLPAYLNFLPSWLVGTFKGSLYKEGTGSNELLNTIFTRHNVSRVEIYTGTVEYHSGKQQLFCNKSKEDSILEKMPFDYKINNCCETKYLDGNIDLISKACLASCSIPIYVLPVKIGENLYQDGGCNFFSPLTPLVDSIDSLTEEKICNDLHIDYFNCRDLESNLNTEGYFNIIQNADNTLNTLMKTLAIQDKLAGISLVKRSVFRDKYKMLYFEGKCDREVLIQIEKSRKYSKRSFLELYVKKNLELDITNFNYDDIMNIVEKARKEYYFRLWITCQNNDVEKIEKILEPFCGK